MNKFLFVIPSLSKGGAEKVVSLLANELINNNEKVTIITHYKTNEEYYTDKRIKIICLSELYEMDYRKKINPFYLLRLIVKLRNTIIEEKPDYILPFLYTTCFRVSIALYGTKYRKKVIQTVRNNPYVFPKNKLIKKYRDFLIRKSKVNIVQNNDQKEYFGEKNRDKIYILNNPIDEKLKRIQKKPHNGFNIISVGRLEPQKNFSLLIEAFNEMKIPKKNICLKIYGDGTLQSDLSNKIDALGLENVFLCGREPDLSIIYSEADMFVLPSIFEGMPNTLMEAMAIGIPCVSSNCQTGTTDLIKDNETGLLFENNNKKDLIVKMEQMILSKNLQKRLGENAKNHIWSNYNIKSITNKLISICRKID